MSGEDRLNEVQPNARGTTESIPAHPKLFQCAALHRRIRIRRGEFAYPARSAKIALNHRLSTLNPSMSIIDVKNPCPSEASNPQISQIHTDNSLAPPIACEFFSIRKTARKANGARAEC